MGFVMIYGRSEWTILGPLDATWISEVMLLHDIVSFLKSISEVDLQTLFLAFMKFAPENACEFSNAPNAPFQPQKSTHLQFGAAIIL